jgi:hypothetical protein
LGKRLTLFTARWVKPIGSDFRPVIAEFGAIPLKRLLSQVLAVTDHTTSCLWLKLVDAPFFQTRAAAKLPWLARRVRDEKPMAANAANLLWGSQPFQNFSRGNLLRFSICLSRSM